MPENYSDIELDIIRAGSEMGYSAAQVADKLPGRNPNAVLEKARKMGLSLRPNGNTVRVNRQTRVAYVRFPTDDAQFNEDDADLRFVAHRLGTRTISATILEALRIAAKALRGLYDTD